MYILFALWLLYVLNPLIPKCIITYFVCRHRKNNMKNNLTLQLKDCDGEQNASIISKIAPNTESF